MLKDPSTEASESVETGPDTATRPLRTKDKSKNVLGSRLLPLVAAHEPDLRRKITGMFLELPEEEILPLLASPEALEDRIAEAVQVLEAANYKPPASKDPHSLRMLGEQLFPLVAQQQPVLAGKITGMLLELEAGEILRLLVSPEDRAAKVDEAVQVIACHCYLLHQHV